MTAPRPAGSLRHRATARRPRARRPRARRAVGVVGVLATALTLGACGRGQEFVENNPPGANVTVNDISVRYAHLEDPDTPGTGYVPGDDVPLYLWLQNESSQDATLVEVSSEIASGVTLEGAQPPVELPIGTLVEMGPDDPHFVLEDITTQIRGAELVPVTLTFSDGARVEIMVEAVEVGAID
ncbi:copper chaperone PCu(A)C [uncultured Cellulomonas sp.]|uniref:copper chaperone PCu(A)C n=1 Tax=uncultured Cellulomonas sp. TaxID=189682 RepID=UPI00260E0D24|nr:copper chaperone PCu(A)C [uncultured Cellulomonas sp.]